MAYVFISEKKLQALITSVVRSEMQNMLWGWTGESETPGLYREFDSLHSRLRALQLKVDTMQVAVDGLNSSLVRLSAAVEAAVAKMGAGGADAAVIVEAAKAVNDAAAKLEAAVSA